MKLKLPAGISSISVGGQEYKVVNGFADVGNLTQTLIDLACQATGALPATDEEAETAAQTALEATPDGRTEKATIIQALKDLGQVVDGRKSIAVLAQQLAEAEAAKPTPVLTPASA